VTDNESKMKCMGTMVTFPWHGCFAHLLELVTKQWAPRSSEFSEIIQACRDVSSHYRNHSQARDGLQAICETLRVTYRVPQLDVATRWWSTHSMLKSIFHLQIPLKAIMSSEVEVGNDHNLKVKFEESWWKSIERAILVLDPLMKTVKALEGEEYVTVSWVPWLLSGIHNALRNAMELYVDDESLVSCVSRLYLDFKRRFCDRDHLDLPKLVKFASALDPRTKNYQYMPLHEEELLWRDMSCTLMSRFDKEKEASNAAANIAMNG
jgi:hypothetical protein